MESPSLDDNYIPPAYHTGHDPTPHLTHSPLCSFPLTFQLFQPQEGEEGFHIPSKLIKYLSQFCQVCVKYQQILTGEQEKKNVLSLHSRQYQKQKDFVYFMVKSSLLLLNFKAPNCIKKNCTIIGNFIIS